MSWDKLQTLTEVQRQGQLCLALYDERAQQKAEAELQITALDRQVMTLDAAAAQWRQHKPTEETFVTRGELEKWQRKADTRSRERSELMLRRRDLMCVVNSERTAMLKLIAQIETLYRSQRNLQALVEGRSPATGWRLLPHQLGSP